MHPKNKRKSGRKTCVPRSLRSNNIVVERKSFAAIVKSPSDSGNYRSFLLNSFPTSDVTSMFQEYRIRSLTLTYALVNAPNNNASFPSLFVAPQHIFAATLPTSRDEVIQYRGSQAYQFGPSRVSYSKTYTPYVSMDANTTGRRFIPSPWLSTSSDAVPHYTNVEWISRYNSTSDPTHTIELWVHALVDCRYTR
jgi:hypothetical protein